VIHRIASAAIALSLILYLVTEVRWFIMVAIGAALFNLIVARRPSIRYHPKANNNNELDCSHCGYWPSQQLPDCPFGNACPHIKEKS
jgi:hypothetical protein